MILLVKVKLPLYVHTTKSRTTKGKVIFNLNNYRNMYFTKSNAAKKKMKKIVKSLQIPKLGSGPFKLVYTYYHGNMRIMDVANPCSIIDKFTCDAITELKLWPDDNYKHVVEIVYKWGGVIPNGGYCELEIFKI